MRKAIRGVVSGELLLFVIVFLTMVGVGPWWGYSHSWGYWPSGIVGLIFLFLFIRLLFS